VFTFVLQNNNDMKAIRITYWITTSLVSFSLLMAGSMYFASAEVAAGFAHLGFPDYLRIELGIAKIIAALVIILPFIPRNVKEWAYAGIGITYISAFIAHTASGDPGSMAASPLISLLIVAASYYTWTRVLQARQRTKTPNLAHADTAA
jgi:hypothetical protein